MRKLFVYAYALPVVALMILAVSPLQGWAQNKNTTKQQKGTTVVSNIDKEVKSSVKMDMVDLKEATGERNLMNDLTGTIWRFQNGASDQSTLHFSSKRGGYFRFNGQDRKFIFTYAYSEGAGSIMRDRSEFGNQIDAARLMTSDFIVEKDTLTYDGRDFLRVKE